MDFAKVYGVAAAAGVASHVLYFHRAEHHKDALYYLQLYGFLFLVGAGALFYLDHAPTYLAAFSSTASIATAYFTGLYGSLLVYRAFLSPLNKFPGTFGARLSSLWLTSRVAGKADLYKQMVKLHNQYGDFVRVGSSDLSILHPDAVTAIYGLGSKCTKSDWYDGDTPRLSMHTTRSKALHDRRRRVWSPAFSDRALRGYEERIKTHGNELVRQLGNFSSGKIDVSKWFDLYGFDVMFDLAFGKSENMLKTGEEHFAVKLLQDGMDAMHLMLPAWLFVLIVKIPGAANGHWKFINYCSGMLFNRMKEPKSESNQKDIMASLLEPFEGKQPSKTELEMLEGDSRLIIVAGSDTTAACLTYMFYHLSKDLAEQEKLYKEVSKFVQSDGSVAHSDLVNCDHLNGCINEALRLNPPVPTALQRLTPPEGIMIGDVHVPGNTTVWCPLYAMMRNERNYTQAESFIPERWYSRPELIKNKNAFFPFSIGPYGCIGKPLALLEIRTVVAKLVTAYSFGFAPGEDGSKLMNESRDHFTVGLAPLELKFDPRTG